MISRRLLRPVSTIALAVLGALLLAASAWASQPEAPVVRAEGARSTGVFLFGTLNPGASEPREPGTYQFVYRPSTTGACKGAGEAFAPASPGVSNGLEREELMPEFIEGLTPGTEYAVCLIATEPGKTEPAVSVAATFKTRILPEQPEVEAPTGVTATTAQLHAVLNPGAPAEPGERYIFRVAREGEECQNGGGEGIPRPGVPLSATGEQDEAVSVTVTDLLPRTAYTVCAVVETEVGETASGGPVAFETPVGSPGIAGLAVEQLRSSEATLVASVFPGALATSLEVKAAGLAAYTKALPASKVAVGVQQHIVGLVPGTRYVVHLLASNEAGSQAAELAFDTPGTAIQGASSSACANRHAAGFHEALPDCRAVELVSSPTEAGEAYDPGGTDGHEEDITTPRPFRAAADGEKIAYVADPGATGGDGSSAKGHGNEFVATRHDGRWSTVNVTPPVGEGESASEEREYTAFSPDLSTGIVASEAPLLAAAPNPQGPQECSILYGVDELSAPPRYAALFTSTLTPGFCGNGAQHSAVGRDGRLAFDGEAPDHTVRVFDSSAELQAPATEAFGYGSNVYASKAPDGQLAVVNVLPSGGVEPRAVAGGPSELPENGPDLENVISPGGDRVIWSSVTPEESLQGENAAFPVALYAREDPFSPSAHTVQLDAAEAGASGPSGGGQFWAASADVNRVFFTDCHRLTADATSVEEGSCEHVVRKHELDLVKTGTDLYEYDFAPGGGRRLTDLTIDHDPSDAVGADVQGVIGTSENGDYVYFVAGGALGAGANSRGELPESEACEDAPLGSEAELEELAGRVPAGLGCNLFELHFDGTSWEPPRFIAKLAARDNVASAEKLNAPSSGSSETAGDWNPALGSRTAEVTPDGQSLVFSSMHDITGYDTANVGPLAGGQGGNEIFLYSAAANSVTCVSCDPRNAPPNPAYQIGNSEHVGFNTYVPVSSSDTFMHRWVNSTGTEVFFDSSQALVKGDGNGEQDVYEWAAQGTPSCPTSTSVYGGCVFLLTGGESEAYSFLVDVDESGANVFVTHRGPLDGVGPAGSKNGLYDLRAGGGGAPQVAEGCTSGATCPAAVTPAVSVGAAASSLVGGEESLAGRPVVKTKKRSHGKKRGSAVKRCGKRHRGPAGKRDTCPRQAHKRSGANRPTAKRRTKR